MLFKKLSLAAIICASVATTGCVTHLSPGQERELDVYETKGLLKAEKSVMLAGFLGIFPVAGYAYTGHPVAATFSIITWPFLGPLWMPFDAGLAARERNYWTTKENAELERRKALSIIDAQLQDKQISYEQHIREQRDIDAKYSPY